MHKTRLSCAIVAALAASPVHAQEAQSKAKIETIEVTATKRSESIQDVPVAVRMKFISVVLQPHNQISCCHLFRHCNLQLLFTWTNSRYPWPAVTSTFTQLTSSA